MVTFWFQVCEGACFAHGWRNFDPPRFAPTQFHHLYLHEEDNIHSCLFFTFLLIPEEDYIHSKFEPNPTVRGRGVSTGGEDGESRQKPRGLKKGVPPFQHVCLFDFDFQYGHVVV